jgi:WD40 repeat protein
MAWAPKGDVLAVDSGLTGLSLWSTSNGKLLRQFSQGNRFLSWSRDGTVLHAQAEHQIRFIDRLNGTVRVVAEHEDIVLGQSVVSPDGKYVAAIVDSRHVDEVDVWLTGKKKPLYQIPPPPQFELVNYTQSRDNSRIGLIGAQAWVSPDGRAFVVQDNSQTEILDIESLRPVLPPFPGKAWVQWSLSGTLVMVGNLGGAGETRLIRIRDGSQVSSFMPEGYSALSANEDMLARCAASGVQ